MAKINLNDLLKEDKVDLTKIERIDVIPTGRSTYYNSLGGLNSFVVDATNKTIKFLGTDANGVETSTFQDGKDTLVARSNGTYVEYLSHLSDEPYQAITQPFSIAIPEGADEGAYLLLAFKEYVRTVYSELFTGMELRIEVTADATPTGLVASIDPGQYKTITGKVGDTFKVEPTVLPADAVNKVLSVAIQDSSVISSANPDNSANGEFLFTINAAGDTNTVLKATDGSGVEFTIPVHATAE